MNPKTEQLLATLEVITEDLLYSSAGDAAIEPFVWQVAEQGEFNLVNFLIYKNRLQIVDLPDFTKAWQRAAKALKQPSNISQTHQPPITLIDELPSHLTDLEFYNLGCDSLASQMIVGKTADDAWIGITALKYGIWTPKFGDYFGIEDGYYSDEAKKIKTQIKPFLEALEFLTKREEQPNQELIWEVAPSKTQVLIKLLNSSQYIQTYKYFGLKHQRLNNFMLSQLKQLRTYVIESGIYAVGQILNGDWLGVSTSGYWD
ncbi:nuclease A inhibitor family protein [Aerosakkonema funiforme]|uniref:Uncharacterized protein n=2 Tax=Oscillatoriophycideae TaxID=1301283 RepID=A0A926ZIU6_9CYAN|nr:nuclease A inhibitor family protein [Aerosakkonema funiforme]MBD2184853.1 hypothetical protein [Aerosakkonema funiforme FACHB-1375]